MRLRYVGSRPVTFTDSRVGEKHPGDEFNLSGEDVDKFLARADVTRVSEPESSAIETQPNTHVTVEAITEASPFAVTLGSDRESDPPAADEPAADQVTTDNS